MKRLLSSLIIVFLILTNFVSINAVEDTTPPTIKKLTSDKREVKGGDTINFSLVGEDDLSGVETFMLEFRSKVDSRKTFSAQIYNNGTTNNFSGAYNISNTILPGDWEFFVVQIWDVAGNLNTYHRSSEEDNQIINFNKLDIVVKGDTSIDRIYPVLNNVSITPSTVKTPGSFTVNVNATDNISKNLDVDIFMSGIDTGTTATKVDGNNYSATFNLTEEDKYRNIEIQHISLRDGDGNQVIYTNDSSGFGTDWETRALPQKYRVNITGIKEKDNTPPKLINYKEEKIMVSVPGVFRPVIEVTDDISGFSDAKLSISEIHADGSRSMAYIMFVSSNSKNGNKYTSELIFDQYNSAKTYVIDEIQINDKAGNQATYSTTSSESKFKIEEKLIQLTKRTASDVSTGTMNDDYIKDVEESGDSSVISIDATKNSTVKAALFDSIRNTNKKIVINNKGIEWVFSGQDIVNSSKDINTSIEISTFSDGIGKINIDQFISGGTGLIIDFHPNGLLPGKALVKIKADYTLRNYVGDNDLYVYYYNQSDGGLEAVANKINISSDGYYEFNILHNSRYLISSKKAISVIKDASSINNDINSEEIKPEEILKTDVKSKGEQTEKETKEDESVSEIFEVVQNDFKMGVVIVLLSILISLGGLAYYYFKRNKEI